MQDDLVEDLLISVEAYIVSISRYKTIAKINL